MFTGIVEATAKIIENTGAALTIERPEAFDDLKIGSSIAVAGVCLSIVGLEKGSMRFDVIDETQQKTNLGSKKPGDRVNLERAMRASARLDGHIVQGHVEGVGCIMGQGTGDKEQQERCHMSHIPCPFTTLVIQLPAFLAKNVIQKGSIAIDGVSLTVAKTEQNLCTIALIPHTIDRTTLGSLRIGDTVNVETDVLSRTGTGTVSLS